MRSVLTHINKLVILFSVAVVSVCCAGKEDKQPIDTTIAKIDISTKNLINIAGDPDNIITSLRVMVFHSGSYLRFNEKVTSGLPSDPGLGWFDFTLNLKTGNYDFVFIVNEDSDEEVHSDAGNKTLSAILDGYDSYKTVNNIYNEYFNSSSFRNDYSIPMTTIVRDVEVKGDNEIYIGGSSTRQPTPWAVNVTRTGIRVDLCIQTASLNMKNGFAGIQLKNVPSKVYMFDKTPANQPKYNVTGSSSFEGTLKSYRAFDNKDGDIYTDLGGGNYTIEATDTEVEFEWNATTQKWYLYKRLILPETFFATKTDGSLGITLEALVYDWTKSLVLSDQAETDYTIPRNYRCRVNGTIISDDIEFSVSVNPWDNNINIPL